MVALPRSILLLRTLQAYTLGGPFVLFPVFIVRIYPTSSMIRGLAGVSFVIILDIETRGWRRLWGSVFKGRGRLVVTIVLSMLFWIGSGNLWVLASTPSSFDDPNSSESATGSEDPLQS
ncbi:hypothetical protein CPB86DRAFT_821132 [Serendipita vermifera]|nr:hypothetical protein CPB86DRAFT_821132 [Serendipita vermifera]